MRDNTGTIVSAVNTGGILRHITDTTKMVGATAVWQNAGYVGTTAIDLRATVLSVTDTNSGTGLTFDPSLNFAISNGDDPSVRIESAEVRIRWEVFAAGTSTRASGDVGFFIRDIDAFGNCRQLYDTLAGGVALTVTGAISAAVGSALLGLAYGKRHLRRRGARR